MTELTLVTTASIITISEVNRVAYTQNDNSGDSLFVCSEGLWIEKKLTASIFNKRHLVPLTELNNGSARLDIPVFTSSIKARPFWTPLLLVQSIWHCCAAFFFLDHQCSSTGCPSARCVTHQHWLVMWCRHVSLTALTVYQVSLFEDVIQHPKTYFVSLIYCCIIIYCRPKPFIFFVSGFSKNASSHYLFLQVS